MFLYVNFFFENIRLNRVITASPDTDVVVISLYQTVTNLTFLDAIWFKEKRWSEIHPYTPISFRIRITNMLLASCNTCNIRMTAFQTLKKQNRPPDRYDQIRWIPLTLFRKSITIDLLPHTSDVLVLHLRRANYQIFLWKSACSLIFNLLTLLENGWVIENRKICTELMLSSSVPGAIIKLTRFKSKKGRKTTSWSCKQANLVGTDSCCCNAHEERDNTSYCKGFENQNEDQT